MSKHTGKTGRPAFGQTQGERDIIDLIVRKRRKSKSGRQPSLNGIARDLNAAGHRTQQGSRWRAESVKNVLRRHNAEGVGGASKSYPHKIQLQQRDYLTPQEVIEYMAKLPGELAVIFWVLVGSGLRASELCALQVRDIAVGKGKQQIDIRRGKGNKSRTVFIDKHTAGLLIKHIAAKSAHGRRPGGAVFLNSWNQPLTYPALHRRIRKMREIVGDPQLHAHGLRHTFATILYGYRKDIKAVKDQLGHNSIATTDIYAKSLPGEKLRQAKVFDDLAAKVETSPEP